MKAEQRITRARVQLQRANPFWAYLSLYLKFKEIEKGRMMCDTMGVDIEGNVYYVEEFVDKLTDKELEFVIAHELGHLIYLTAVRREGRDMNGFNIASDVAINSLLQRNNFTLIKDVCVPNHEDKFETGFKPIEKCSEKTAEQIYDELPKVELKNGYFVVSQKGGVQGKKIGRMLDVHIEGGEDDGKEGKDGKKKEGIGRKLTPNEVREIEKEWQSRIVEAHTIAKMKGDVPEGIDRLVGHLHEEKINWRVLLQRYIVNQIPYNYTYARPSKKSISVGEYLPETIKEKVEIALMVDLSGSIGQEEYTDFISEVIGICKAYQEKITMRVFSHDTETYDCGLIENGNIEKVKNLQLKGGGGTSFQNPLKFLEDNEITPTCLLWFTDGYGDKVKAPNFDILWILSKNSSDECIKDTGQIIRLGE